MQDIVLTCCPVCRCNRFQRVPTIPHSTQKDFATPIVMMSVAYTHSDDVRAFKKRHPNIQCSVNPRDPLYGVPIVTNRHDKMAVLRGEKYEERN